MGTTDWLRKQVHRLEEEIRSHRVFDSPVPATPSDLEALHAKVTIHTYLKQQLLRRETVAPLPDEEYDTAEFAIVR